MRMVVDLPAPLGPRKPKTSPLLTARLSRSTAVKSPKRLTRFSITTELAASCMACLSNLDAAADCIHKEVFDGRSYLLNCVVGHAGVLQARFEFGNALCGIVHHHVHAVAGEHKA